MMQRTAILALVGSLVALGSSACAATLRTGVLSTVDGRDDVGVEVAATLGVGAGDENGGVLLTGTLSGGPMLSSDVETPFTGAFLLGLEGDYFDDETMAMIGIQGGPRARSEAGGYFGGLLCAGYAFFGDAYLGAMLLGGHDSVTSWELGGGVFLAFGGGFDSPF
jgi:hypothetical protein